MTGKHRNKVDELKSALRKKHEAEEASKRSAPAEEGAGREPGPGGGADEIAEQLRLAEEEARGHYDKLLRVMAEFENFKKRISKEQEEQIRYANEKLLADLLPSLDDLDRVIEHVPPDADGEAKTIAEGVELVRKNLLATLARYDLKEVESLGEPFDPTRHEAIAAVESEAHDPNTVMAVHRKGYWLGERASQGGDGDRRQGQGLSLFRGDR